jgi:beta-lactamase regulating signal transducer with metallopeptidase domain
LLGGRRSGEASTLVRWSDAATGRLAFAADRHGIAARTIDEERPFCALVGTWKPTVIVSTGALSRLSDSELDAALLHERGHAHRGDQIIAAVLSFLVDLLPLPATDLVAIYRRAREIAADRHALENVQGHELAGALLTFVKRRTIPTEAAALVGDSSIRARLALLLDDGPRAPVSIGRRYALALALAAILGAGLAPASAAVLHHQPCTMNMSRLVR